ncbi:hypothetical protein ACH5RR_025446 [Cinchona calisaya]|uniref:Uncharacterized protein n=1 Tax=Cinchona calisaya TaxID=153742 RepID=A0ABD2YZM9_9GENT
MWPRSLSLVVNFFLILINISKQRLLLWMHRSSVPPLLPTTTGELELSPAPAEVPPPIIIIEQQQPPRQEANVEVHLGPAGELPTTTGELELRPDVGIEEPTPIVIIQQQQQQQPPRQANVVVDDTNMQQWALLVVGVCFTAVRAALQAYQTQKPLPIIFHWFCMALELSFISLVLSIYVRRGGYQLASLVMAHAAVFLGATAFMMAIGMNFPPPFMQISIALYFIVIPIIIFANLFTL